MERLDRLLEARPIEYLNAKGPGISRKVASELLLLLGTAMPLASIYLWRKFLVNKDDPKPIDEWLAALLFIALSYGDVGCFLAAPDLAELLTGTAKALDLNDREQTDAFLMAVATLPPSLLESVIDKLVLVIGERGATDLVAILLSFVFSTQHQTLLNCASRESFSLREKVVLERRISLSAHIQLALGQEIESRPRLTGTTREILAADLSIASTMPREDQPAWVARTLSALLHRGGHPSFLSEQISRLLDEPSSVDTVRKGLLQVLELFERLPPSVGDDLRPRVADLTERIRACAADDSSLCRQLALDVAEGLWLQSVHRQFFLTPESLIAELRRLTLVPARAYAVHGLQTHHYLFLPNPVEIMTWEAFGPAHTILDSHLTNLLVNPAKHFPRELLKLAHDDIPLCIGYLKLDESKELLHLILADRAKVPNRDRLFALSHGLANMRAYMQVFGGSIEYRQAEGGMLLSDYAPDSVQRDAMLSRCGRQNSNYRNVFITSFPLMLKAT